MATPSAVFPEEVSPDVLRTRYSDLAGFDDEAVRAHFHAYGRDEGRAASDAAFRQVFVGLIDSDQSLLEIGPFCQPVFEGPNVRYLDILDADALKGRGEAIGMDVGRCPRTIHYTRGLAEAAGANFDVIFSSHNLEHQPDLIGHLNEAAAALAAGGVYAMLIPDKRYCFDHFLPETTVAEVLEAHVEGRTRHAARHVVEHMAMTTHNDSAAHWRGEHGERSIGTDGRLSQAVAAINAANGDYIDVHAWKFTPQIFREITSALTAMGVCRLKPLRVYDTPHGSNEFSAVMVVADDHGR